MGLAAAFISEKLVIGVLTSRPERKEEITDALTARWGPADYCGEPFPFTFTSYYDEEMGTPISRFFLSFEGLRDPSLLAAIKSETNALEERWSEAGRRWVNLDPGFLTLSRFTLATTKESAHRIPLAEGIFAEITLLWHKGSFQPLPWTYPDFRSDRYRSILNAIRARYKTQLDADPGRRR
jgi:hypothetical protein